MANPAVYGLSTRHELATRVIESYAGKQPKGGIAMSVARRVVPAGGIVELVASFALQAPDLYQPMARDLAVIYGVGVEALTQSVIAADERSARAGAALAGDLSPEFLRSLIQEIVPELWMSAAAGMVPGIGRWLASAPDAALTATLAWRLGTMAVLYLLNGEAWLGSKADTHVLARQMVGKASGQLRGRVRLDDLPYRVPQIYWHLVDGLAADIQAMRRTDPTITDERIRALLQRAGVRDDQIESALSPT
ncbi:MAG TPA: hypothetical protein VHB98_03770 [Chloroflexota bacterium]|nr:hypothetical protein [Chloroflexota bacterium]